MMKLIDNISKLIVDIDEAATSLLGIALYVAPDADYTIHDLLKIDGSRENGDHHLHISTKLHLSSIGSIIVTALIARYVLCSKTPRHPSFIAKFQILFTALVLPLLVEESNELWL